jgi:hypothetical protein
MQTSMRTVMIHCCGIGIATLLFLVARLFSTAVFPSFIPLNIIFVYTGAILAPIVFLSVATIAFYRASIQEKQFFFGFAHLYFCGFAAMDLATSKMDFRFDDPLQPRAFISPELYLLLLIVVLSVYGVEIVVSKRRFDRVGFALQTIATVAMYNFLWAGTDSI